MTNKYYMSRDFMGSFIGRKKSKNRISKHILIFNGN